MLSQDSTPRPPGHAPWQVLASREIYSAPPWVRLSLQQIRLPNGQVVSDYHRVEMPEYAVIYAETTGGKIIVERQYKHGIGQVSLTLPAGLVESQEDTFQASQRELREETGYSAPSGVTWEALSRTPTTAAARLISIMLVAPIASPLRTQAISKRSKSCFSLQPRCWKPCAPVKSLP